MKGFSIIVAADEKMGIGRANGLPWRLSLDMKHFKEITLAEDEKGRSNVVIMGRKTWDSLPEKFRPLPGRVNAVITANAEMSFPAGVKSFSSLEKAFAYFCGDNGQEYGHVFVVGGARVYGESILSPLCQRLYITHILGDHACDAYFPAVPSKFRPLKKTPLFLESEEKFFFAEYSASV